MNVCINRTLDWGNNKGYYLLWLWLRNFVYTAFSVCVFISGSRQRSEEGHSQAQPRVYCYGGVRNDSLFFSLFYLSTEKVMEGRERRRKSKKKKKKNEN